MMIFLYIIILMTQNPEISIDEYYKGNYVQAYNILNEWFNGENGQIGNDVYGFFYAISSCDTHLTLSVFNNIINFYAKNPYRIDAIKENLFYYKLKDDPIKGIKLLDIIRNDYPAETLKPYYKAYRYFFSKKLKLEDTLKFRDSLSPVFFTVKKVMYSFDKNEVEDNKKTNKVQHKSKSYSKWQYYVQVCALSSKVKAEKVRKRLNYNAVIVRRKNMYKVWVGPFNSYSEVKKILRKLRKEYKDAFIVKEKRE